MSNNSDHIRDAITRLGFFTGDIGEHQFVARLLNLAASGNGIDATASAEAFEALDGGVDLAQDSTLDGLMGALIGMTDGGTFINNFITAVSDFLAGTDDPSFNETLVEAIKGDPEAGTRLFTVTSEVIHGTGTEFCNSVRLSSILGTSDFNSNFEAPTKEKPNIGIFQFHNPALNFANRSSGLAGVFFNLLPTVEISKCQPFVDVKLLTKTPQLNTTTTGNQIGDGISLLRFLGGKRVVEDGDPWPQALPVGLNMPTQPKLDENGNAMFDENGQPITENAPATVAGMEVFTSPQTLVNGNEPHYDIGPRRITPAGRQASVIDKFRPFLTLKSFDVKVVPARGMISTKSAQISLTLHDRSRLAEIGQLVRPDGLSDVEIMVEYGWSHPEGFGTRNDFATLLNALRVKEKFQTVNSSMSFNDVGEVDITLQLVSKGNNDLTFRMVTDAEVAQTFDQVTLLFRKIREIKRSIRADLVENEEMIGAQVMGKANSISAILSMSATEMQHLQAVIDVIQSNPNQTEEYSALANTMQEAIVGAQSLEGLIQTAMAAKATRMKTGVDPYAKGCAHLGINYEEVSGTPSGVRLQNHVSFAKLATEYIAKPLAATKKFEEVQLCFYPLNQYATFARDDDVGSFPVNIAVFEKQLAEKLKKNPALTLAAFVGFMNSTFFNNMASDIYGFGSLYERDPNSGKAKLRKKFEESQEERTKIASEKKAVFEAAYGPGAEQKFTKPSIQMYLETVPGAGTDNGGENATILRIHFFDQSATSYSGFAEMWDSLRSSLASSINMAAVTAFRARESPPDADPSQAANLSHYSALFSQQLALLAQLDILEGVDSDGNAVPIDQLSPAFDAISGNESDPATVEEVQAATNIEYVRIKGGPAGLKYMFHRNMPSIKYGSTYSAVIKANLATQNDSRMATIHMQRAQKAGNGPDGGTDDGLPMRTFPGQLSMDIYGCPLINFGQQYFIDFGTGTTLDDVYAVTGVDHKFTPGSFVTSIKFVPLQKFGSYQSLLGNFSKMIAEVQSLGSDAEEETT
mgnify:CR=1 FL=1